MTKNNTGRYIAVYTWSEAGLTDVELQQVVRIFQENGFDRLLDVKHKVNNVLTFERIEMVGTDEAFIEGIVPARVIVDDVIVFGERFSGVLESSQLETLRAKGSDSLPSSVSEWRALTS